MSNISETIKKLCEEEGIKISDLEKEAGLSRAAISRWKDDLPKSIISLMKISHILNVSTDYLLGINVVENSNNSKSIIDLIINKTQKSEIEWEKIEYTKLKTNPLNLNKNLFDLYYTYCYEIKDSKIIFIYSEQYYSYNKYYLFLYKNGEYIPINYKAFEINKLYNLIMHQSKKAIINLLEDLQEQ